MSHEELNRTMAMIDDEMLTNEFYANPYPLFRQLRETDPVHWSDYWGGWILTRFADVTAMLRDPRQFSNVGRMSGFLSQLPDAVRREIEPFENHFKQGLINSDPPDHARLRGLLNKAFTPAAVEKQRPWVEQIVNELLDAVQERGRMDMIGDFAYLLPTTVIAQMMGVPLQDRHQFKRRAEDITGFVGTGRVIANLALDAHRSLLELREYFRQLIAARRNDPQPDLITALATAEDQGNIFGEAELLSVCITLLLAGYETTMSFIGNAMLALLRHPEQLQLLRNNPLLITPAVEELLRFDSPVQRQWRVATKDLEIGGKSIAKGQLVGAMLGAANRDPEQFPDPDRLDIARQDNRHIAFGYGIHFCLGAPLARLEGAIALNTLIRRFPNMRLGDHPPQWRPEIVIHGLKSLPVVF